MTVAGDALATFFERLQPCAGEQVVWPEGLRFRVETFLTQEQPPLSYVTSARALVLRDGGVLVLSDRSPSTHILPGGRIEPGESVQQTLIREVSEESGWTVVPGRQVAVRHFRHLQGRPEGYPYLYPVFLQVVHVAVAVELRPELREVDGWETEAKFVSFDEAAALPLSEGERRLLVAAREIAEVSLYDSFGL